MEFDNDLEKISPVNTTTITIGGTGGLVVPSGTNAQRPANTIGLIRFNTESGELEINTGSGWTGAGGGGSVNEMQLGNLLAFAAAHG